MALDAATRQGCHCYLMRMASTNHFPCPRGSPGALGFPSQFVKAWYTLYGNAWATLDVSGRRFFFLFRGRSNDSLFVNLIFIVGCLALVQWSWELGSYVAVQSEAKRVGHASEHWESGDQNVSTQLIPIISCFIITIHRTVFSPWKLESLALGSENSLLKGWTISSISSCFLINRALSQFWNPLSVNFSFYPHMFTRFCSCLAVALSTQSLLCLERHCHCRT